MAKAVKGGGGIIRYLLIGILIMVALLFGKYIYLPKVGELRAVNESIKEEKNRKDELKKLIAEAKTSPRPAPAPPPPRQTRRFVPPTNIQSTTLGELLSDVFHYGDIERVSALRVKPGKVVNGQVPLDLTVSGRYHDTIRFLRNASTLKGVGGISSIEIGDVRWETDRYVVTTTVTLPTQLIE